jgi:hypothetical protein
MFKIISVFEERYTDTRGQMCCVIVNFSWEVEAIKISKKMKSGFISSAQPTPISKAHSLNKF